MIRSGFIFYPIVRTYAIGQYESAGVEIFVYKFLIMISSLISPLILRKINYGWHFATLRGKANA